jgi:hypothetical protein
MGGNGHAYIGYDGADEQFYVEQTKRELSNQAFRKKALEVGSSVQLASARLAQL